MALMRYYIILIAGAACLCAAFSLAMSMRGQLQQSHHVKAAQASAMSVFPFVRLPVITSALDAEGHGVSGLPPHVVLLTIAGALMSLVGGLGCFELQPIRRQYYAARATYDMSTFSGTDFMHFNNRGSLFSTGHSK